MHKVTDLKNSLIVQIWILLLKQQNNTLPR